MTVNVTLRGVKGTALSHAEVDGNFSSLKQEFDSLAAADSTVVIGGQQAAKVQFEVSHLKQLGDSPKINGRKYRVNGFYENTSLGGGIFIYDSSKDKATHNGGTILDPLRLSAWSGSFSDLNTLYTAGTGLGCFIKQDELLTVDSFGGVSSEVGVIDTILTKMESLGITTITINNRLYKVDTFVPSTYGLNFQGSGKIQIKTGHVFNVSVCEQPSPKTSHSIMFTDVDWDWGTVAYLKSIGYDTMFTYGSFSQPNQLLLLKSCVAAKSKLLAYSNLATASLPQLIDGYKEVIGYYIYDEPDALSIPIATQDARIASYRTVTNKPLWCSVAIDSELNQLVSTSFDVALVQLYYGEGTTRTKYGGGSLSRSNTLRSLELVGSFKQKMPNTEIVPIVGLFTNAGYSLNVSSISRFSQFAVRTTNNGTFATFIWGGNSDPNNIKSVKDDPTLLLGAKLVAAAALDSNRITVTPVVFASDVDFDYASMDGCTTHLKYKITPNTNNVFPLSVKNVGSAVDDYNQGFHDRGVAAVLTGGYAVIGVPHSSCSGVNYCRMTFKNYVDVNNAEIGLSVTQDGGHTFTDITGDIAANLGNFRYYLSPSNVGLPATYSLALKIKPLVNFAAQPWKFLAGWVYCSNWPDVTY